TACASGLPQFLRDLPPGRRALDLKIKVSTRLEIEHGPGDNRRNRLPGRTSASGRSVLGVRARCGRLRKALWRQLRGCVCIDISVRGGSAVAAEAGPPLLLPGGRQHTFAISTCGGKRSSVQRGQRTLAGQLLEPCRKFRGSRPVIRAIPYR